MNWLQMIDDMPGPEFLLFYGAVNQSEEMFSRLQYATRYDVEPGEPEIREAARKALKEM